MHLLDWLRRPAYIRAANLALAARTAELEAERDDARAQRDRLNTRNAQLEALWIERDAKWHADYARVTKERDDARAQLAALQQQNGTAAADTADLPDYQWQEEPPAQNGTEKPRTPRKKKTSQSVN